VVTRFAALAIVLACPLARAETVTLHSDASVHSRASEPARQVLTLPAGERVDVIAQRDGWLRVRARGRTGWISREHVSELDQRALEVAVTAGLSVLTQGLRTTGSAASDDNYNIGLTAATLAIAGRYASRRDRDTLLGVELAYSYRTALAGIRHVDPQRGQATTTAVSIHGASARVVLGYVLHESMQLVVAARAGVRYHQFRIDGASDPAINPSRIPSELQLSPTIGVELVAGELASKLGLGLAVDTHVIAVRTRQTPGQQDGTRANASGATVQATLAYRWRPDLDLRVAHEIGLTRLDFGAPDPMSARVHGGTAVTRFDVVHSLTLGIARRF
jgi:hypothetical protein